MSESEQRQIEWPETREEMRALPELERMKLAGSMFWAMIGAPVPSASDAKWSRYCQGLRYIGLPEWAVDDIRRPHREWKDLRNERRRLKRLQKRGIA